MFDKFLAEYDRHNFVKFYTEAHVINGIITGIIAFLNT